VSGRGRLGPLALGVAVASAAAITLVALLLLSPPLLEALQRPAQRALYLTAVGGFGLLSLLAGALGLGAQRLARGTPGRLRLSLLGYAAALFAASGCASLLLLSVIEERLPKGAALGLEDAIWILPAAFRGALVGLGCALGATALVTLSTLISAWFLLPLRARTIAFVLLDVLLLGGFAFATYTYDLTPTKLTSTALAGASARLAITLVLGVRVAVRLLPLVLDLIERIDFRTLVAARHLRAKKSGFLAAISFLAILAVSVSSCALTTTLSVMGGFRQDLKRKILGNNAHIVVDRVDQRLPDYAALGARVRGVDGVRGVSPYLTGEVMISSASNLAGAVLRGIDLGHIGEVSELPRNMRVGSLSYLAEPEKLKNLPAGQLTGSTPDAKQADDESEAEPGKHAPLSDAIAKALEDKTRAQAADPSDRGASAVSAASTLPGIVVGQELARSLRLYLGDEVNVVTPLGDLGPTGPLPKSRPFRVAGIFYSGMYEYDMKFAYVTLSAAQRFLGGGDTASGIEITTREPERAQDVATRIAARAGTPGLRVRPWQELNKNLFGALALEKLAMFIALGIAILVASFCIVGTLTLMVQEKGREVAVLKAMGTGDRAIVAIFVLEGTLIGVLGSALGLALGYAMCFAAEHFGVRLNPEVYYIDKLPVHIDPSEFIAVGLAAIAVSLIVTIYPAQLASRLRPVDALRYE
jgi:lipoprotein-releasing system permease protein